MKLELFEKIYKYTILAFAFLSIWYIIPVSNNQTEVAMFDKILFILYLLVIYVNTGVLLRIVLKTQTSLNFIEKLKVYHISGSFMHILISIITLYYASVGGRGTVIKLALGPPYYHFLGIPVDMEVFLFWLVTIPGMAFLLALLFRWAFEKGILGSVSEPMNIDEIRDLLFGLMKSDLPLRISEIAEMTGYSANFWKAKFLQLIGNETLRGKFDGEEFIREKDDDIGNMIDALLSQFEKMEEDRSAKI